VTIKVQLTAIEARVLGCLIEKDLTTPEYYPLSLNALANACNQKSNRDPLMSLGEQEVQAALDSLIKNHLASTKSSAGSRVSKYAHRLNNPITQSFNFSRHEQAVLCELLLRGPQTVGELRTRAARMAEFADLAQVEATLRGLGSRDDGPYIQELPRQPGRRESRFAHLFCGAPVAQADVCDAPPQDTGARSADDRIERLEREVTELRTDVAALRKQLEDVLGTPSPNGDTP
jgi:hypothetical protein